mgnify:CR=1 FL=1
MARHISGALLPGLSLVRSGRAPINRQLFQELREVVLSGRLKPGTRMPATRHLAAELGVSRTTVAQAYEQLKSEGYLLGREKSGTFIPEVLPDARSALAPRPSTSAAEPGTPAPTLARHYRHSRESCGLRAAFRSSGPPTNHPTAIDSVSFFRFFSRCNQAVTKTSFHSRIRRRRRLYPAME